VRQWLARARSRRLIDIPLREVNLGGPGPLGATHDLPLFDCGKPLPDEWQVRHARQDQASGATLISGDFKLIDHSTFTAGDAQTGEKHTQGPN
jgi:hypothetical protein